MVSCAPTKYPTTRRLSITVSSATVCFTINQECLSESICHTFTRTVFRKHTNQKTIKDGRGEPMGIRDEAVKQYKKSKSKRKKYLKALKKQKKILFRIANNSGSRRELKNTKNIREKSSKKRCNYSSDSSSDKLDSNSSPSIYSKRDTYRRPAGRKGVHKLDHVVTDNIKMNKYQLNKDIYN